MGSSALTSVDDALDGIHSLGFDTSPFIYFIERHPKYIELVRDVFHRIDRAAIQGFTSVVTLTEVLTLPMQAGNQLIAAEYRNLLLNSQNLSLVEIDARIAENAAYLRALYRLRTPDALQIAAALQAGCEAFITNDAALRRVNELRICVLDDLTL